MSPPCMNLRETVTPLFPSLGHIFCPEGVTFCKNWHAFFPSVLSLGKQQWILPAKLIDL